MAKNLDIVSSNELAKLFGLTIQRIHQLAADGVIPKTGRGEFPKDECIRAYICFLKELAARPGGENEVIARSRARYEAARAEEREIDLAERKRELVHVDDVMDEVSKMVANFRARVLAIPSAVAAQGVGMTSRAELENLAKNKVYEALHELSRYDPQPTKRKAGAAKRGRKSKAAAGDDGQ